VLLCLDHFGRDQQIAMVREAQRCDELRQSKDDVVCSFRL
jgi:hypothetical protein